MRMCLCTFIGFQDEKRPVLGLINFSIELVKIQLADDGRPAPAALPGDCCGLPSPTRVAGRIQTAEN